MPHLRVRRRDTTRRDVRASASSALFLGCLGFAAACRGGAAAPPSPAIGLPGLDALGYRLISSDFDHGFVADSAMEGSTAYFAGRDGLRVVDLADPAAPRLLAAVPTVSGQPLNDVALDGTLAFVTTGERDDRAPGTLIVYDVSRPEAPLELGRAEVADAAIGVSVVDGYAYVGAYAEGLVIVDVRDPRAPTRVSTWAVPDPDALTIADGTAHVWWPAVRPPLAYVTYDGAGLFILDVGDPSAPALVGSFDRPTSNGLADCFFNEIELDGDLAYVALDYCGLTVLDVSDPTTPREIAFVDVWSGTPWEHTPGHAIQLERDGDDLFVTTSRDGLYVYDVSSPIAPVLTHAYPASHAAGRGCLWGMSLTPDLLVLDYTLCLPVSGITGGIEVFGRVP